MKHQYTRMTCAIYCKIYSIDLCDLLTLVISVIRLIKNWLTNRNVIIADDVLSEIRTFVNAVNSSTALRELALEVLQYIPDQVRFF